MASPKKFLFLLIILCTKTKKKVKLIERDIKISKKGVWLCLAEENGKDIRLQHIRERKSLERTDIRSNCILCQFGRDG